MVYVNIDKDKLLESVGDVAGINKNLISIQNDFDAITKSLDSDIKDMAQINENITKISNDMYGNIDDLSKLFIYLQYAHSEYSKLDNIDDGTLNIENSYEVDDIEFWEDFLSEIIDDYGGILGSKVNIQNSYLNYLLNGDDHYDLELGTQLVNLIEKMYVEIVGKSAVVSGLAKAGTTLFSLFKNTYKNIEEYKEGGISSTRLVSEIVLETAIEVGTPIAIKCLAATALTALGVSTGGAAVIGYGVYIVADYYCQKYTGDSFAELVSDLVLDKVDVVVSTTNKIASEIADVIVDTVNIVTDVVGDVVDYGKNLTNDIGDAIQALNPFTKLSFG